MVVKDNGLQQHKDLFFLGGFHWVVFGM